MNDTQYLHYNQQLARTLAASIQAQVPQLSPDDPFSEWLNALRQAADDTELLHRDGPGLMQRLFTTYPQFAPLVPRDLLWFLGGDCLHVMPDEEIAQHQALDELRHEAAGQGEILDYNAARARLEQPDA
jgi:hypothetical protein